MDPLASEAGLIDMETLERLAPLIRHAAHPMRLRIIDYLAHAGEARSVGDIMLAAGAEQAIVSQQLRILKDQGIVSGRREGNHVFYGLATDHVLLLLECIRRHNGACAQVARN